MSNKNVLPFHPKKPINLLDMIQVCGVEIWALIFALSEFEKKLLAEFRQHGPSSAVPQDQKNDIALKIPEYLKCLSNLEMSMSCNRLMHLRTLLRMRRCLTTVVANEVLALQLQIAEEARHRYFAFIPSQRLIFFEKDSLFGRDVQLKFPSATNEIRDIGNCMALDLHTAAVFHCMRVVEHGLRALAIHLKVKVKYPLEFAEWGVIIKGIDRKLADLQPKARGKKKAEALEFYRLANDDCNMFKDVWRNSVMHTRGRFPEHEALGVFLRVQSFMQRLSQRNIGEVS